MVERAVLLIADIGGYTRFMTWHRLNLAHAQEAIGSLLEAIVDAAGSFKLAKLEGDAAFFAGPPGAGTAKDITAMRQAFLRRRGALMAESMCKCDSCMQIGTLTLKFVVHEGELVRQRVAGREELAGVDVILVHRMLKNDVPIREYALASDAAERHVAPLGPATEIVHALEGIGDTRTCYVDLSTVAVVEPEPRPTFMQKVLAKLSLEARTIPYLLGLREACKGFENLPPAEDGTLGGTAREKQRAAAKGPQPSR